MEYEKKEYLFISTQDVDTTAFDLIDAVKDVFEIVGIRYGHIEEIILAVLYEEEVVAGATLGHRNEDGEIVFTFSVAVLDGHQQKGIGRKLVEMLINEIRSIGTGGYIRVWVVNPIMAKLLEDMKFETEGRGWSQDSPHMTFWIH